MQSNAGPSKTEKQIKKVRAIFCEMHAIIFEFFRWNGKQNAQIREVESIGSQGWKRNRSEVRSCSPATVPWPAKSCGTTAVPWNMTNAANSDFVWRWALTREAPEVAKEDRGQSGNMWQGKRFGLPKDQFLQAMPMYTARPIRFKTPWPWRLAGTNWSNRVRFGQRCPRTSCFYVAYVILSEIHAFLCMLFAEVCFFDACVVFGTWPLPNCMKGWCWGVQVVLRKTQSRWHCSNPSTPARQTSRGRCTTIFCNRSLGNQLKQAWPILKIWEGHESWNLILQ